MLLLAAILAVQLTTDVGLAEIADIPGVEIRTYAIDNSVSFSLGDAMRHARPAAQDGERAVVRTDWRYDWHWAKDGEGRCDPRSARTEQTIVMMLPNLDPAAEFDERDVERWRLLIADIIDYEHGRIALVEEGRIRSDAVMRSATGCSEMEAAARAVHAETRRRIVDYEERNTPRRNRMVL